MMGSDCCVRIERFDNGFTVEIRDPAIDKKNKARDNSTKKDAPYVPWQDPWKTFVFKTDMEVTKFLAKNLKKAISKPQSDGSFDSSFDVAVSDNDGDE
jgi:hypothetical protein